MTGNMNKQKITKTSRPYDFEEWETRKPRNKNNKTVKVKKDKYYNENNDLDSLLVETGEA